MYGSVAEFSVKPGHEDDVVGLFSNNDRTPDGAIAIFVLRPDAGGNWLAVAVFESQESYVAKAELPEQHEVFLGLMEHLESEPTWTDGHYVVGDIM